jgi:hypothetical protein
MRYTTLERDLYADVVLFGWKLASINVLDDYYISDGESIVCIDDTGDGLLVMKCTVKLVLNVDISFGACMRLFRRN